MLVYQHDYHSQTGSGFKMHKNWVFRAEKVIYKRGILVQEVSVHLEVELESACVSGQVRPPLYSFDSTQPLSCLGSSVVRASA